jgi:6-phosphogluconolactonase
VKVLTSDDVTTDAAALMRSMLSTRLQSTDRVSLAVSGGSTPWAALERLATVDLDWSRVDVFQVDERIVLAGDPSRNLVRLRASLTDRVAAKLHPMPVEADDLEQAAARYAASLPRHIDIVQLGLGSDGHTASLVPGDAVLDSSADVAITGRYHGHRRMTLTFAPINRARQIIWIVTGVEKRHAVRQLLKSDTSIPAGRASTERAILIADRAALGE